MAGKLIVDTIDTDNAFITLNVQQSLIATMNVSGIYSNTGVQMIGANGTVSNTAITGLITASQIATVANTQITGLVTASQIATVANTQITGNLTATTSTNLSGGGANTVVYQSAAGTTAYLTNGTTGQFLAANTSGAPTWGTPGGGFSQAQVFTSSGSFTVPSSGKFKVTIIGGGGSGGTRGDGTHTAGGAGGGGSVVKWFTGATSGATANVTIGSGGAGIVSSVSTNGNVGGNSTFVLSGFTTLTANGGSAGIGTTPDGNSVAGGTAAGGDLNIDGGRGSPAIETAGSARNRSTVSGSTLLGIGAAVFNPTGSSIAGTGYGSGSSGSYTSSSVAGQGGVCVVEY